MLTLDPYRLIRPLLFQLYPETAHGLAFGLGGLAQRLPGAMPLCQALCGTPDPSLARNVFGLAFRSPIGLAAGLDKGAHLLPLWKALGFGFVEIGTVTPRPQPGNPKPRVFRVPEEGLILNRMGFNSEGMEVVARRLRHRPGGLVVGGNLGKNKTTPEEAALDDYAAAYRAIAPLVDYVALNISSPNTPGLRRLQAPEALKPLLEGMLALRKEMGLERQPLLVKLAPDLASRRTGRHPGSAGGLRRGRGDRHQHHPGPGRRLGAEPGPGGGPGGRRPVRRASRSRPGPCSRASSSGCPRASAWWPAAASAPARTPPGPCRTARPWCRSTRR